MKRIELNKILDYMDTHRMYPDYYPGISEMGYDDKPMICADWWIRKNGSLREHPIMSFIEKNFDCEIETHWHDEWTPCNECYRAVRVSPDSYGWEVSYVWTSECSIVCRECVDKNEEFQWEAIEYYKNNTNRAAPSWFYPYLEQHGFICYSPDEYCKVFETGFHSGQNDDPREVAKDIKNNLPGYDYLFKIDSVGQFDCRWSVFLKKELTQL